LGDVLPLRGAQGNSKHEILSTKQIQNSNDQNSKLFWIYYFENLILFRPPASLDAKHLRAGISNLEFRIFSRFARGLQQTILKRLFIKNTGLCKSVS
jgi:hypothetical protein